MYFFNRSKTLAALSRRNTPLGPMLRKNTRGGNLSITISVVLTWLGWFGTSLFLIVLSWLDRLICTLIIFPRPSPLQCFIFLRVASFMISLCVSFLCCTLVKRLFCILYPTPLFVLFLLRSFVSETRALRLFTSFCSRVFGFLCFVVCYHKCVPLRWTMGADTGCTDVVG